MIKIQEISEDLVRTLKTVNSKVFPMLAKEGTSLPFITYQRLSISPENTKCGVPSLTTTWQIDIVSKEYLQGVALLDTVISQVTRMNSPYDLSHRVFISGASEEAFDDGYAQTLNIDIETSWS